MLPILLASALAVVVGADYITAEDHLKHIQHELTPKQQKGVLLYEDLIHQYNKKHGIEEKKPQWLYIPLPPGHKEEEKKLFTPNIQATHKHHLTPVKEDVLISHLKPINHGNHEKLIENYIRLPETPNHHKVEHHPQVTINPQPLPPYIIKEEQERLAHEQHYKGDHERVVGEYKALLHSPKFVDGYGRILNVPENSQQHYHQQQEPLTPHLISHSHQHEIGHEVIKQHNGPHQVPIKPQLLLPHHGQQEVKHGLINEHGRLLANPELTQHHNGPHQVSIKPQLLHPHHDQKEVKHGLIDEHGRLLANPEHIQHHYGQNQIPIKPQLLLQHHGHQEVKHGLIDEHGRLLVNSEHIQHHHEQNQIPIKPQLLLQQHGHQEVKHGLIDEHWRLLTNPEHIQHYNEQHQIPIKSQLLLQHHGQQEVRHGLIDEHGRLLANPEHIQHHNGHHQISNKPQLILQHHGQQVKHGLIDEHGRLLPKPEIIPLHHKVNHNQGILIKANTPLLHHNQEVVHERVIDEYGRFFDNLHHEHQHQIIANNKDSLIELNRLKELSKEGEHYVKPQFDDHKLRHHELVGYIERLQKNNIEHAHHHHDERKQEKNNHNIREHESRLQYTIEHH